MVRIVIKHDVIAVPVPVCAVIQIVRRNREVESSEPESRRATTNKSPYVMRTDRLREMSVLPGVVEMIMRIIPASIVSDPLVILRVDVRRRRVSLLVSKVAVFRSGSCSTRRSRRSRAMLRDEAAAHSMFAASGSCRSRARMPMLLRKDWKAKQQNKQGNPR